MADDARAGDDVAKEVETTGAPVPMVVDVTGNMIRDSRVILNLGQEVHVTTKDKVELALRKSLPNYRSTQDLLAVWAVFLSLGLALLTSDFKDRLGLTKETWFAVFLVTAAMALGWAVYESVRWKHRCTEDAVVEAVLRAGDEADLNR